MVRDPDVAATFGDAESVNKAPGTVLGGMPIRIRSRTA
jgi:hypothetical protein